MELTALIQYVYLTDEIADEIGVDFHLPPYEALYHP